MDPTDPDRHVPSEAELTGVRGIALVLRFALELALLAAVGWSAWTAVGAHWWRWLVAAAAVAAVAVVWGAWLSPRAPLPATGWARVLIEAVLFGGAGAWLGVLGHPWVGLALAGLWALDRAVIAVAPRPAARRAGPGGA